MAAPVVQGVPARVLATKSIHDCIAEATHCVDAAGYVVSDLSNSMKGNPVVAVMGQGVGNVGSSATDILEAIKVYQDAAVEDTNLQHSVFFMIPNIGMAQQAADNIANFAYSMVLAERQRIRMEFESWVAGVGNIAEMKNKVDAIGVAVNEIDKAWSSINDKQSVSRVVNAKKRSDLKMIMEEGVRDITVLYENETMLKEAMNNILQKQRDDLTRVGGDASKLRTSITDREMIKMLDQQWKDVDRKIRLSREERECTGDAKRLNIPVNFTSGKGDKFILHMRAFVSANLHKMTIGKWFIDRIGQDRGVGSI
jgi:hypothetical protein